MFTWSARSREKSAPAAASAPLIVETISASRALPKFFTALSAQPAPTLLDLGPVVGANVSFFGERLSCKMLIEDLHEVIDAQMAVPSEDPNALGNALAARVAEVAPDQVDGILCWDIFDYLDRRAARALANGLRQVLRPKGVLHGFFATTSGEFNYRTRFVVQSETSVKCRCEPARPTRRQPLQSGEIARFFEPLSIVESVLLQSKTREALFRQPG